MTTCFNCGKELKGNSRHVVVCAGKIGIEKAEAKRLQINHKIGFEVSKDYLEEFYIVKEMSLPDMKNILEISFNEITQLLDFYKIPRRNQKGAGKKRAQKAKSTLQDKFGVDNVSQLDSIKKKKKETFTKNYGVDNIFKASNFKEKRDKVMMEKYGKLGICIPMNRHQNLSDERKAEMYNSLNKSYLDWVSNLTEIEKTERSKKYSKVQKKIWSNLTSEEKSEKMKHLWNGNISKLELRIQLVLSSLMIPFSTQFELGNKFFDFRLQKTKIIIEVNGDYWHANPKLYLADDLINYPNGTMTAKVIWDRDIKKNTFAESKGYSVIKIWEQEMKSLNDEELEKLLLERIENVEHSND